MRQMFDSTTETARARTTSDEDEQKDEMPVRQSRHSIAFATWLLIATLHLAALSVDATANAAQSTSTASVIPSPFGSPNSHEKTLVAPRSQLQGRQFADVVSDIQIKCNSDSIAVTLTTSNGFNGMIYPKGLSKTPTCMSEYHQLTPNITYHLPLRSCNTMSTEVEDGVEYYNTVMVQPHRRLVTNQGRGYYIRCRYQTKERTISNLEQQLSVNMTQSTPAVVGSVAMPTCSMKIFSASDLSHEVAAENVRIGDELQLVVQLDDQEVYGMQVTNCLVRDGLNLGEQVLIDDHGCPVNEEIMPKFEYASNLTRASVAFQAHKFPYTSSVYYQCNVRLCFKQGGCDHLPPACDGHLSPSPGNSNEIAGGRRRRWVDGGELDALETEQMPSRVVSKDEKSLSLEVFSGLRVDDSEATKPDDSTRGAAGEPTAAASTSSSKRQVDVGESNAVAAAAAAGEDAADATSTPTLTSTTSDKDLCLSLRKLAIAISLASLILMAAIIIMIACMIQRRKRIRQMEQLNQQQQQQQIRGDYDDHYGYDRNPYTNRAYARE